MDEPTNHILARARARYWPRACDPHHPGVARLAAAMATVPLSHEATEAQREKIYLGVKRQTYLNNYVDLIKGLETYRYPLPTMEWQLRYATEACTLFYASNVRLLMEHLVNTIKEVQASLN